MLQIDMTIARLMLASMMFIRLIIFIWHFLVCYCYRLLYRKGAPP